MAFLGRRLGCGGSVGILTEHDRMSPHGTFREVKAPQTQRLKSSGKSGGPQLSGGALARAKRCLCGQSSSTPVTAAGYAGGDGAHTAAFRDPWEAGLRGEVESAQCTDSPFLPPSCVSSFCIRGRVSDASPETTVHCFLQRSMPGSARQAAATCTYSAHTLVGHMAKPLISRCQHS